MDALFCFHIMLMLFASVAIAFIGVGYSTPGWLAVTFDEDLTSRKSTVSSINRSLWYDIHCPEELLSCKTCIYTKSDECVDDMNFNAYSSHYYWLQQESDISEREGWLVWRILMSVVLGSGVLGHIIVTLLVCCLLAPSTYRLLSTIGFIMWILAGILVWPVVALVGKLHSDIQDAIDINIIHDATLHMPYSVVLVAVGAVFAIVAAIMLLWLTGFCCKTSDEDTSTLVDDRRSKQSKVMHKAAYYGPSSVQGSSFPYYGPEMPTEYRDAPRQMFSREQSVTTDEEFYVVESPFHAAPHYDNRFVSPAY